jgi:preprotein translocase subunit SecY
VATSANAVAGAGKYADLKRRLWFLAMALIVYRIGTHIPVPLIDPEQFRRYFESKQGGLLGMFDLFAGGATSRFSIFAIGIMPYISASIILQMLTYVLPSLESLRKEGESGRRRITQYTRYATVGLAAIQSYAAVAMLEGNVAIEPGPLFRLVGVASLVTGSMFLMWLGEQITERGIGNGISIIIFSGIVAGLPGALARLFELVSTGALGYLSFFAIAGLVMGVTAFVVFVEKGQRRITVNYAKRQVGNRVYGGQSSYLPLKLNMSGVIPPIFASSIVLFPATVAGMFSSSDGGVRWVRDLAATLQHGQPLYLMVYSLLIIFFCFFYTSLVFNSKEQADNLKKSGAFVPGIRPGDQTARHIDKILLRLTMVGAAYITVVCLVPEFLYMRWSVPFYFGGTSLLIIVVVTMDFWAQVQAYLMTHQYESLLKKANFRGGTGLTR